MPGHTRFGRNSDNYSHESEKFAKGGEDVEASVSRYGLV